MSGFDLFMVVWCVCVFLLITVPVIVAHHDRLAVPLMRRFNIPAYPEAVGIALLIYQHPEQWTCRSHEMLHAKVGTIWTGNEAYGLYVDSPFGRWKPNKIERRIIRDAVDWRIKTYVKGRIAQALSAGLVTGRVTDV